MQLLLQVCRMRCQIQEQAVLLDALSQDFRFSAAQLRQLCWEPEIAGEVMWRLLHCTEAPYLLLLAAPSFRVHVNALQRTCQLRAFNAQCPNGHYRLDLANPADVEVGQRLVTLDRW
ncbi:High affinity nitrate transporter 2.5, partial [Durusdinium trenchii]